MRYVTSVERQAWEEGRQEGFQLGLQQGLQQGTARQLQRLLMRRFGPLPAARLACLQQAPCGLLLFWGERAMDATSLEEVFAASPC